MSFAKLIDEVDSVAHVHGTETEDEYKRAFVEASFAAIRKAVSRSLAKANLGKPHIVRFRMQVHAQELYEKEK